MLTMFTRQSIQTYSGLCFQIVIMKKDGIKQARPLGDQKQNLNCEMTHREQIQNTKESHLFLLASVNSTVKIRGKIMYIILFTRERKWLINKYFQFI